MFAVMSGMRDAVDLPKMSVRSDECLPILAIQGIVIFPEMISPVRVEQDAAMALVLDAMRGSRLVGLVAQPQNAPLQLEALPHVGTTALVHQMCRSPDGSLRILLQGIRRFRIGEVLCSDPYLLARVKEAPEIEAGGREVEHLAQRTREEYRKLLALSSGVPSELSHGVAELHSPRELAYWAAATCSLSLREKQELLELDSVAGKLRRLLELLGDQIEQRSRHGEASGLPIVGTRRARREPDEIECTSVHQEEVARLAGALARAGLPEQVRREVDRELGRFATLPVSSSERAVVGTYLDWMAGLPWSEGHSGPVDIGEARQQLDRDHYGLDEVKTRVLEHLAIDRLRCLGGRAPGAKSRRRAPIMCLLGPPGVGKTSLGESIARAAGRRFVRVTLGGVHDEAEIRGHRRTYVGAMPGRIVQALRRAGTSDPVCMLDEIDKLGVSLQGDPGAALLEVLDPAQNHAFVDNYLAAPIDLSQVMFVCTANTVDSLPPALLDRLEVLLLSGYTEADKVNIAERYLVPSLLEENGLAGHQVNLEREAIRAVVRGYTREAGVRSLGRQLSQVFRRTALHVASISGEKAQVISLDVNAVRACLGRPRFSCDAEDRTERPGVATGLAWTEAGGELLFVEAAMISAREESLILTGMLGEVMRESARAALSYLRSEGAENGIDRHAFDGKSLHVHIPAGAVPKDGPSAGATILVALASLARGRPAPLDVAVTGEITLRGRILPVGGVREKVLAAERAGLAKVVLPRANERDLDDLPEETRQKLAFLFVDSADEVLELTAC